MAKYARERAGDCLQARPFTPRTYVTRDVTRDKLFSDAFSQSAAEVRLQRQKE